MAVVKRESKTFDIDQSSFNSIDLKGYIRTYFVEGSLNISSEVPILILENKPIISFSGGHFEVCISKDHPFYNLFKELSKDNIDLYNNYFKEKYSTKIKEKITLRIYYEENQKIKFLHESKLFCKLDIQVKISHYEGLLYEEDCDSEYIDYWFFRLDLNKIDFV